MSIGTILSQLFKSSASAKKVITPVTQVVQKETFGGAPLSKYTVYASTSTITPDLNSKVNLSS